MVAARRAAPPPRQADPIIHGSPIISRWLTHYWQKLELPAQELPLLAITQDRQEYMRWTGKRLNIMALGCYCYLPAPVAARSHAHRSAPARALPGFHDKTQLHKQGKQEKDTQQRGHRHLIFIEPDMQPQSV